MNKPVSESDSVTTFFIIVIGVVCGLIFWQFLNILWDIFIDAIARVFTY